MQKSWTLTGFSFSNGTIFDLSMFYIITLAKNIWVLDCFGQNKQLKDAALESMIGIFLLIYRLIQKNLLEAQHKSRSTNQQPSNPSDIRQQL